MRDFPKCAPWQAALGHVLVDEYQDTNATQYELLKLLVGEKGSLTAVGDDDQSIYGWRGATLDNLKKLPVDYPHLKVIKLEQNYRSTSAILRAANNVIGPNPKLFPKRLFSELGEGEPGARGRCRQRGARSRARRGPHPEPARPATRRRTGRASPSCTAPTTRPSRSRRRCARPTFRTRCRAAPAFLTGRKSHLCAWFRLWINNDDDPAFLRAITTPKRGIGHTTLAALGAFATQHKQSMFGALFNGMLPAAIPARDGRSARVWPLHQLPGVQRPPRVHGQKKPRAFPNDWLKEIGYEQHLYDNEDSEKVAAARWSNVMEFCDWMAQRAGGQIDDTAGAVVAKETKSLLEVSQTIALLSTISEREQEQDMVTLSTLHASKGWSGPTWCWWA